MKRLIILTLTMMLAPSTFPAPPARTPAGIPLFKSKPTAKPTNRFVYRDAPAVATALVTVEQAKAILGNFKLAYAKMGQPRVDIRVNQPWGTLPVATAPVPGVGLAPDIDPNTGLPLKSGVPLSPPAVAPEAVPVTAAILPPTRLFDTSALSDQQTKRDVQRLFGRPLRMAGVKLHDADLVNLPEVSLEVLLSEHTVKLHGIGGEQELTVPDIQVTAIRLADGRIIGQATVLDLFPRPEQAAHQLRQRTIYQLAEATALMLMRDMAMTAD